MCGDGKWSIGKSDLQCGRSPLSMITLSTKSSYIRFITRERCHAERSEASRCRIAEMFRFAQHDNEMQGSFLYRVLMFAMGILLVLAVILVRLPHPFCQSVLEARSVKYPPEKVRFGL